MRRRLIMSPETAADAIKNGNYSLVRLKECPFIKSDRAWMIFKNPPDSVTDAITVTMPLPMTEGSSSVETIVEQEVYIAPIAIETELYSSGYSSFITINGKTFGSSSAVTIIGNSGLYTCGVGSTKQVFFIINFN